MPGFFDTVGAMFSNLAGGPDGVHARVWNELKPWVTNLGPAASRKWIPRVASGDLCEVPVMRRGHKHADCDNIGLAICGVCKRPCCLQHAHIDQHADAICYLCVADAMQIVPPLQRERARQERAAGTEPPPPRGQRPPPGSAPPPKQKPGPTPEMIAAALAVLGLRRGAKWDAVKTAYKKLTFANHPDRAKGARAKAAAEARFHEVQQAFDLLKKIYPEAE
jgi:hypothetical protein